MLSNEVIPVPVPVGNNSTYVQVLRHQSVGDFRPPCEWDENTYGKKKGKK